MPRKVRLLFRVAVNLFNVLADDVLWQSSKKMFLILDIYSSDRRVQIL